MAVMRSADRGGVTAVKRCGDATLMTETRTRVSSAYRRAAQIAADNVMNQPNVLFSNRFVREHRKFPTLSLVAQ